MYEITWRSFTPERLHFECNGVNCPETRKIQKGQKSLNEGKTVVRSWLSNIIVSAGRIIVRNVSPRDKLLFHHHHHHHYHQSVLTIIKPFFLPVPSPRHRKYLQGEPSLVQLHLPLNQWTSGTTLAVR